ncbi:hypothetical protein LU11_gp265 [Pseudomonas phage Lu11]|uniref:hypothetical protein n=1 Tax=Pseudomonas phage Lu11 TaxID=1161927 RepID=UPI00025F1830|nr:hypothetical protein LU11_gp265 [Pseudomonas phage Lu11]AFH14796.1 hypothetical protein Lu11_0260A [Pseudomonas phage Lu11]
MRIGKVSDAPLAGFVDVRIDRKTIFGNKFPISLTGSRKESCDRYEAWAFSRMRKPKSKYRRRILALRQQYLAGAKLRLLCHCYPKRCHGQTIRKLIMGAS